jgi:hypothetical protein
MPAAEEPQRLGVERLNPQRKKTDAESLPGADARGIDVLGVGLERNPGAVLDRKVSASRRQDAREIVRRQRRRSAAAEVDRIDAVEPRTIRSPEGDFREQMIDEPPPPLRPAGQDREVAVGADGGTEGDVEIEAGERGGIQGRLFQESGWRRRCITATTVKSSFLKA